jgi:hypothetical protein
MQTQRLKNIYHPTYEKIEEVEITKEQEKVNVNTVVKNGTQDTDVTQKISQKNYTLAKQKISRNQTQKNQLQKKWEKIKMTCQISSIMTHQEYH